MSLPKASLREYLAAIPLGLAGFLLNTFELQLGWGMHFIFGNALIFACMRLIAPQTLVLAVAISSLWTIFLWHHPWAWLIWVCEAIFIAYYARKISPVLSDIGFWLLLGAPLILLTYGAVMKMDQLSLTLVLFKQSTNGILNVVIGELVYIALISINPMQKIGHWPKVRGESFVLTLCMALILIPTAVSFAQDADQREQAARQEVGKNIEYRLRVSNAAINNWVQSRSLVLRMSGEQQFGRNGMPDKRLLDDLSPEFVHIVITAKGRRVRWSAVSHDNLMQRVSDELGHNALLSRNGGIRLVALTPPRARRSAQFALFVPFTVDGKSGTIVAQLRDGTLENLVDVERSGPGYGTFLVSSVQGVFPLTPDTAALRKRVLAISENQQLESISSPVLLTEVAYGQAIMSDLRNAEILRSSGISELPEWQVRAVAPLEPAVIAARQLQRQQFAALIVFLLITTVVAFIVSRRLTRSMGLLAQSAADLVAAGAGLQPAGGVVLQELNEIYVRIASAGITVGRERGALASNQRRLNHIARHVPMIVYALDIVDGAKGAIVYVSENLEKILGYSAADAMQPGWWSHAVHPDDYAQCMAAFKTLAPDQVVNVEYRLMHKEGYYIWVYDTLAVEPNPQNDNLEAIGVIMDISQRKAAAEQLLQADKMASLGRMISGTAHELNQPLNFIKMATTNLRENSVRGIFDADRFLPKLDNILAQVERASAIILQMRIFGRTPKDSPHPIDVKAAVDAVVTMVAPQFELDGTQVEAIERNGPVFVQALPMSLEQVLLNLLLNANDAIRSRYGKADTASGRIKVTVERRGQFAVIIVQDNGTGIAADVLSNIFDPFFTTKPAKEGTGLGLSISYGIIRDLGGVITAKSGRNGAGFKIELPLVDAPSSGPGLVLTEG